MTSEFQTSLTGAQAITDGRILTVFLLLWSFMRIILFSVKCLSWCIPNFDDFEKSSHFLLIFYLRLEILICGLSKPWNPWKLVLPWKNIIFMVDCYYCIYHLFAVLKLQLKIGYFIVLLQWLTSSSYYNIISLDFEIIYGFRN